MKVSASDYISNLIRIVKEGWEVKFEEVEEIKLKNSIVSIPLDKLVIGLANGWATKTNGKMLCIFEKEIKTTIEKLSENNLLPRGFMYWTILNEGDEVIDNTGKSVNYFLTKYLKKYFLMDSKVNKVK